jgi:hypothetical protein
MVIKSIRRGGWPSFADLENKIKSGVWEEIFI